MYNDGMEILNLFQQVTVQVGWKGLIMYKKEYVSMERYGSSLGQCKCKGKAMKKKTCIVAWTKEMITLTQG